MALTDKQIMDGQTEPIARQGDDVVRWSARVESGRTHTNSYDPAADADVVAEALSFVFGISMEDSRLAQEIDPSQGLWWIPIPAELAVDEPWIETYVDEFSGYRVTFTS